MAANGVAFFVRGFVWGHALFIFPEKRVKNERKRGLGKMAVFVFVFFLALLFTGFTGKLYVALIIAAVVTAMNELIKAKERKKKEKEQLKRQEEYQNSIANGEWDFPRDLFYAKCKEAGFDSLESSFYVTKAKLIADEILMENQIPEEHFHFYDSKEKIEEYLSLERQAAAELALREEEKKKHPQVAALTNTQKDLMAFYDMLKSKLGNEKREAMLDRIIISYNDKISKVEDAQESMKKLGVILASSASQTKTTSWATAAGIANGLAGPVAGVLAGADTILKNAQIEEQNRRHREAVNKMAVNIYSGAINLDDNIYALEVEKAEFENAKKELTSKVALSDVDTQEIFNSLTIANIKITEEENNHMLKISAELTSSYIPKNVPQNVKMTVDGTLTGTVKAGELTVGTVILPLPLFGVECGSPVAASVETICDNYSINGNPYSISFTPNNLWIMEV